MNLYTWASFDEVEYQLSPGNCIGFRAGTGIAHQVVNRTDETVTYIKVGHRVPGDTGPFQKDDLTLKLGTDSTLIPMHKAGTPY